MIFRPLLSLYLLAPSITAFPSARLLPRAGDSVNFFQPSHECSLENGPTDDGTDIRSVLPDTIFFGGAVDAAMLAEGGDYAKCAASQYEVVVPGNDM